jgi:hypothetical protein
MSARFPVLRKGEDYRQWPKFLNDASFPEDMLATDEHRWTQMKIRKGKDSVREWRLQISVAWAARPCLRNSKHGLAARATGFSQHPIQLLFLISSVFIRGDSPDCQLDAVRRR